MKQKLSRSNIFNNIGLKLLAVLIAIITWLVVMNISDYTVTKTITGITVVTENGDAIENLGKVYDVSNGKTVDIVVKGPRSVVDSLTKEDFVASADLSKLSITNTVTVTVEAKNESVGSRVDISIVDDILKLTIEDKKSQQFPIKVVYTGDVAEGYYLGKPTTTPNLITIEGPESVLESINEVRAVVKVDGKTGSFDELAEIKCFDAYGTDLSDKSITFDTKTVTVKTKIYATKEVPVKITTVGDPAEGYVSTGINYNPTSILIAGEAEDLKKTAAIYISDINLSDLNSDKEVNIDITNYLPEGIYVADDNNQIAVNLSIEKVADKKLSVSADAIKINDKDESKYEYSLKLPQNYSVTLSGLNKDIKDVAVSMLAPELSVKDLGEGEYQLSVTYKTSDNYTIKNDTKVTVTIKEKNTEESTTEGSTEE